MLTYIRNLMTDKSGATAIEYALIAALVAVGLVTALTTLGGDIGTTFGDISAQLGGGS